MKLEITSSKSRRQNGFTLPEILIASAILVVVVGGILAAHLFGLRMFQFNQNKLVATEWSRTTFAKFTDEIHSCNLVKVVTAVDTNGGFTELLDGEIQQGSGVLLYPTGDTNNYVLYFVNATDQTFRKTVVTTNGESTLVLADSVTNTLAFTAQNSFGQPLTNDVNNRVIHLELDFSQPQHFQVNEANYKLETSVTRRALQ